MMPLANAQSSKVVHMLEAHRPIALETHPNNFVQWRFTAKEHPEAFRVSDTITPLLML